VLSFLSLLVTSFRQLLEASKGTAFSSAVLLHWTRVSVPFSRRSTSSLASCHLYSELEGDEIYDSTYALTL
jgi:hypothetical protein